MMDPDPTACKDSLDDRRRTMGKCQGVGAPQVLAPRRAVTALVTPQAMGSDQT